MGYFRRYFGFLFFYLESLVYAKGRLIAVEDFNIRVDNHDDNDVMKFLDLLYSLGPTQHVTSPTHDKGHILDLIITRTDDACVTTMAYDWLLPYNYSLTAITTTFTRPRNETVVRSFRYICHPNINS